MGEWMNTMSNPGWSEFAYTTLASANIGVKVTARSRIVNIRNHGIGLK
jgi:hypothetical protein